MSVFVSRYLVQYELVQVGHVPLTGHGAVIIIAEVSLEGRRIVRDPQNAVKVMRQNLCTHTHTNTV